jgi:predicted PurR-regulated permease PerM
MGSSRATSHAFTKTRPPLALFAGYVAAALGVGSLFLLAWHLRNILLLTFGAIVVAAIIRAVARPLIKNFPSHEKLAVTGAIFSLIIVASGVSWLFGQQVGSQMRGLSEQLPGAVTAVKDRLQQNAAGRFLVEKLQGSGESSGALDGVKKAATLTFDSIGHALLMLVAGIYLSLTPGLYVNGTVRLFPDAHREKVRNALLAAGFSLQRWLLGQLVSMTTIGTLTTLGLWIVGCPVPLALGILAGLLTFIPVIGFVVAFVPTVLMALSESPQVAIASIIVFLIVQQLEEQLVLPLAQKWATAFGLLALAAAGVIFGLPGLIFGCPLTVVTLCLVEKLYLENGIERPAAIQTKE